MSPEGRNAVVGGVLCALLLLFITHPELNTAAAGGCLREYKRLQGGRACRPEPTDLPCFLNLKPPDSKMPPGSLQISGTGFLLFVCLFVILNNFYHMLSLQSELAGASLVFVGTAWHAPAKWWDWHVQPPYAC